MKSDTTNFKDFFKKSLAEKINKNPQFSLRALARKAGLSPSHLSRAINGETKVSSTAAYKIANGLGLSQQDTQEFIRLSGLESLDFATKEKILGKSGSNSLKRNVLNLELFEIISDWHYFAIYELIKSQPKKSRPIWIARRLGLDTLSTKIALDKLAHAGFIKKVPSGNYETSSDEGIYTGNDVPHVAIKNHHQQVSRKAIEAIDLPVQEREFQSLQFAFDRRQIKKAQEKIRKFIHEFETEFSMKNASDIYQMNLQLFSLTKEEKI